MTDEKTNMDAPRTGAKRGAKPAPEGETNAAKFKRVGEPRINNAVKAIDLLIALSNKSTYDYTPAQVQTITNNLDSAVQRVKDAFAGKAVPAGGVTL